MIRGKKGPTVVKANIPIEGKLHNRFDFEVIDGATGKIKQRAYAENIILNTFWNKLFTFAGECNLAIHIGTGTGTLSPTRTALFTYLTGKVSDKGIDLSADGANFGAIVNEAEGWVSQKKSAKWLETENMNTAWSEVGIASAAGTNNLLTHALIKDLNGNPVTINKGTTDIINVYSTIYAYLPLVGLLNGDITFHFPRKIPKGYYIPGLLQWMLGNGGSPAGKVYWMKGDISLPSPGTNTPFAAEGVYIAYNQDGTVNGQTGDAATKTATIKLARIPAASGNGPTGIKGFMFSAGTGPGANNSIQLKVPGTWYPHSAITAETIGTGDGTILDFKTYFPFIKNDASFVLKKNGATVDPADYTVDYGEPNGPDILPFCRVLDYLDSATAVGCKISQIAGTWSIFENPWFEKFPITGFSSGGYNYGADFQCSDSPTGPWSANINTVPLFTANGHKRYWKMIQKDGYTYFSGAPSAALAAAKNIHFVAGKAPLAGDVITADYHCEVIAKSINNVFDLTMTITLQEKVSV